MGCKAAETTRNINNAFGPELLMNIQCSGGSRSFAREPRALKMSSIAAGHGRWKWPTESNHGSWSPYNYTRRCQGNQHRPFYGCSASEANWKAEKAWWAECYSKKIILKCHLLLFYTTTNDFLIGLWWKVGFISQPAMTSSVAGLTISSKALPKAKFASRKGHGNW